MHIKRLIFIPFQLLKSILNTKYIKLSSFKHTTLLRKLFIFLLICMFFLPLQGCWDYRDIDKRTILISVGVDYIDEMIEFYGEAAQLTSTRDRKSENSEMMGVYEWYSQGRDFEETRLDLFQQSPHPEFLGATRVVVFGKNYAEIGIEPYLHRIEGSYDYRKTLLAVVSKDRPRDLFKVKVDRDQSVGFFIENNINYLTQSGKAVYTTIGEMLSDISMGNIGYVLPYIGIVDNTIRYLGIAVMKNSRLMGVINVKDTDGLLYLLGENPRLTEDIPSPQDFENIYSFGTTVNNKKIETQFIDERPVINIDLDISAQLRYQYYAEQINDDEVKKFEESISVKIKKDIIKVIERSQNEFQCDIFEFAKHFKGNDPETFEKINWEEAYPKSIFNINVKTKITNFSLFDPNAEKKY